MVVSGRARTVRGVLLALLGGVGWGFSGTCAEFMFESYSVDPIWLTSMRMFLSGIIFICIALVIDRQRLIGAVKDRQSLTRLLLYGLFGIAFCQITYHMAIMNTDSGTATVLEMLGLAIIMFYSCRLSHRLPRKREITGLVLALAGVFLIATHGDVTSLAMPVPGLVWGLLSAIGLAAYNLLPTRMIGKWGSMVTIGVGLLIGGFVVCCIEQPWTAFPSLTIDGGFIFGSLGLTLVGTVMAGWAYLQAISDIGPVKASLIAAVEPIAATVFSATWLHTVFPSIDLVGFALIIAMVILVSSKSDKESESASC